jgi:hypothetical protein
VPPRSEPRSRARRAGRRGAGRIAAALAIAAATVLLAACSSGFDPSTPCAGKDDRIAGAYPALEAQVPKAFRGTAPGQLDSGRICSTDGLATLKSHGIDEVDYAGGVWNTGDQSGVSLATFTSPGPTPLQPAWVAEFYQTGAANGKNVDTVEAGNYFVTDGTVARKIDVLNDESYQSVIVWQRDGRIQVALVADFIREVQTKAAHEQNVRDAVNSWLVADGLQPVPSDLQIDEGSAAPSPS